MKIGFVGPIDTALLAETLDLGKDALPVAYGFPMNSMLVCALLAAGHEVVVFGLSDQISEPKAWDFGALKIRLGRYRHDHRARDFFKTERADLVSALESEPCDILHAHWTYEFALAALRVDQDTLITVQDWAPTILWQMPDAYRLIRCWMALAVYCKGQHFSVNSPYLKKVIERWTFNSAELIPNGIPSESFKRVTKWKGANESRAVVAINRGFFKRKNLPALLKAFNQVRAAQPMLRLKLIGSGSEKGGQGHQWAIEQQLDGGVDFLGDLAYAQAQSHLSDASLLVHPSFEESFGMVLIEAMAKGVPVIGGERSGAVPWVLNEGRAGLLVDVANVDSIAVGMTSLLTNESEWQRYSDAGYEYASEHFQMSAVAGRYLDEYDKILSRKGKHSASINRFTNKGSTGMCGVGKDL
jgi:glycosyltransferase involved in cell wall biosynthesis